MLKITNTKVYYEHIKRVVFKTLKKFEDKEPPLGRWKRVEGKSADQRIDWANEDHCGPCGQLKVVKRPFRAVKRPFKVVKRPVKAIVKNT
tara:strand:- start:780 stop:1049 length:270 start_codon:yes stop_codon:yes gene_type:complete